MANYEVQIKLRADGAYDNLYPTVPPAVSTQIRQNANSISSLKACQLKAKPNQQLYYNASGGGSTVTIEKSMANYSLAVATIKDDDNTIINTSPMYFGQKTGYAGDVAEGIASTWASNSAKYIVDVVRETDTSDAGHVTIINASTGASAGSLIALIGVI